MLAASEACSMGAHRTCYWVKRSAPKSSHLDLPIKKHTACVGLLWDCCVALSAIRSGLEASLPQCALSLWR